LAQPLTKKGEKLDAEPGLVCQRSQKVAPIKEEQMAVCCR